jgi:DNA-binding NarL/FixJ family response regulator
LRRTQVRATLGASDQWADFDAIAESWFEDDQEVARRVAGTRGRQRAKAVQYLLQSVLEQRRERWAEHFLLTALWIKEAPDNAALPWRKFAVLARALANGHDLSDIALMCEIADRTVSVLAFE